VRAWNGWYHVNGNTYGTWLPGDPRGWRARHHREHVDGDYRSPPLPDECVEKHARSKRLLARPPVHLSERARTLACQTMVRVLQDKACEVIALSVDDHHFHILLRFPSHSRVAPRSQTGRHGASLALARYCVGIAKKSSARALSEASLVPPGGVWTTRFRCLPIADRAHQVNVARYIADHRQRGAAVWTVWEQKRKEP